jgi:hypothetical protein
LPEYRHQEPGTIRDGDEIVCVLARFRAMRCLASVHEALHCVNA